MFRMTTHDTIAPEPAGVTAARLSAFRARVDHSIAALNDGDPEPLLAGYADDVRVITPLYRAGDAVGEPVLVGRSSFRDYLLRFLQAYGRYALVDVALNPRSFLIVVAVPGDHRITISVECDENLIGRRVMMLHGDAGRFAVDDARAGD